MPFSPGAPSGPGSPGSPFCPFCHRQNQVWINQTSQFFCDIKCNKQYSRNLLVDRVGQEVLYLPAERQSGDVNAFNLVFVNLIVVCRLGHMTW